jgi:predicted DNA repair protein MutK
VASSLLALLDDIVTLLDDVSVLTKVAAQKTASVVGDDLALSTQQMAGLRAARELPVVWAVAKRSLLNKAILVPAALAISAFAPWAVMPLLMMGGAYLCYEGFEKLAHTFLHRQPTDAAQRAELARARSDPTTNLVSVEKAKIKGAARTDFVLSAEIIVIGLSIVADAPIATRVAALGGIALLMTAGVYGLVGAIVKLDDVGLYLRGRGGDAVVARIQRRIGARILEAAPLLMKGLSIAGTAAMFLVGGGILVHGIPVLHGWIEGVAESVPASPGIGRMLRLAISLLLDAVTGIVAGASVLAVATGMRRVWRRRPAGPQPR